MEKCGKVWRSDGVTADQHATPGEVYSENGAGANVMRACSACAGDYEDPERTAWTLDDEEEEERDDAPSATTEEFPAEE